jgi:hypothetical protein
MNFQKESIISVKVKEIEILDMPLLRKIREIG